MRITVLLAHILLLLGALELLITGLFSFSVISFLFGANSFLKKLVYCLVGVSGVVCVAFLLIFKPFKSLCR